MPLDFSKLPDQSAPEGIDLTGLPDSNADQLKGYYRQANESSDLYSEIDNLSKSTGLPKPVVKNDLPAAKKLAAQPDWNSVTPKVSNILANDLELFKVAKDDVENLSKIERSAKALGAGAVQATLGISKSIHQTPETVSRVAEYGAQKIESLGLPRFLDPLRAVQSIGEYFAKGKIPGTGIQTGGMTDLANRIGEAQDILNTESETFSRLSEKGKMADEALKNALFGKAASPDAPDMIDLLTDPEAWAGFIGQAAPSLYTAYKSGGSIPFIAWLEGLDAADNAFQFEQMTGQRISPEQFTQAVAQSATVNAILERYGLDKVFGEPAGNFLSDVIKRAIAEGGTEALQQLNSNVAAYITYNPEQDLTQGIMGSAMGGFGTGGVGGGVSAIEQRVAKRAAASEASTYKANAMDAITKASVTSGLRKNNKESFSRIMNQILGDDAEDIYLGSEDAVEFFQSNPEAFDVIQENLPDVSESIKEASETGGDVVIPAKDYVTYLADYHEQLGDKIRIGADGVSLTESTKWKETDSEQFKAEADDILRARERDDGADQVHQSIRDQLMATGRFTNDVANQYAAIHRAFSVAMSERLGISPQEVYDTYGLRVQVPPPAAKPIPPPGEAAVAGGTQLEQQQIKTPIPLEDEVKQLRARVAELETELRTSKVTGLRNKTAFDEDEGLGLASVGAGDMDGLKRLNDTIGHKAADAVLKTLGDVMLSAESVTEGAKVYHISGDEFAFRFDSDATGQAFMDNLQRRLENVNVELDVETAEGVVHYVYEGIGLSFGVGANYEIADQNAAQQKVQRLEAGIREEARVAGPPRRLRAIAGGESIVSPPSESQVNDSLGINVEELSDEDYLYAYKLFDKLQASQSALQTEGSIGKTIAETGPKETWTSKTAIVDESGKPALVYRGASRALQQADFGPEALGFNTGFAAAGLGVWFTSNSDEASSYGPNVESFNLDIRNPKVFTIGGEEDIPDFDTVADATAYRDYLKEKGFDGIVVDLREIGEGFHAVAFDSTQAIRPEHLFYQEYDYRIQHTAPVKDGANTADDTSDIYPDDVYDPSVSWNYYGHGGSKEQIAIDKRSAQIISKLKGEPDKEVTIYRAVPKGVNDINPGDWVTINKDYADTHGISQFGEGGYDVIQRVVTAKEIATDGNSIHEWGYSPEQTIRAPEMLYQEIKKRNRGVVLLYPDIKEHPSIIYLFEDANLSTFLHESGHFFFEVMTDIAKQSDAPQQILDDMKILLDWHGIESLEKWSSMSVEERRDYHEKFARGFEAYLFEGKAPSVELKGVFQRFRSWLVSLYKSIRVLDVNITDEVRGVFDRMLAADDQIKNAEAMSNYRPLFDSIEQARMTKTEWDAYQALDESSRADAQEELDKRSLRDMQWLSNAKSKILKKLQKESVAKRRSVSAEVTDELSKEPVYQATKFFMTGEMTGPDGEDIKVTQGFKLNKDEVLALYPPGELASVDLVKLNGMLSTSDGMNIDLAGQMFGFDNGDQLVKTILASPNFKEAVNSRTDQVMIERYGDISSPEALERAANEAVHNEARAKFVATEMRALNRMVGKTSDIIRAAKQYAADTISAKTVRESVKSVKYRSAEARAARDAMTALKKDDPQKAAQYKRAQILNMHLAKESENAAKEVEKTVSYLKKFERKNTRKNLRGDMLVQLDALLERFDLRKSPVRIVEKESLTEWAQKEAERLDAVVPNLDPIATNENIRKHYKDLTLDELRGLRDTVRQLEHMARRENKLYLERRKLGFEQEKQAILSELNAAHPEAFDENGLPLQYRKDRLPLLKEYRNRFRSKLDAEMLNLENLLDTMTLGKGNQIFDSLFSRLSEAADAQTKMMKDLGKFLDPFTKAYTRKERLAFSMSPSRVFVPEVGEYFTRDKRVAVALFYGSLDGRQRLRDGNGYTDGQVKAILRTLNDKDIDFINAMWEMSDEKIWPELKALDERTKGIAAKKIDPAPYIINGRPMRGGYVPLVYDGDLSTRAYDLNTDNAINELRGGMATQASTRQSASKQRLEEVKRALDLSLAAISYKINETVHDITHREAVTDTYRLLKSNRLSNAIRSIAGPDVYKAILTKVRETAVSPSVPHGITERALWYLRKNTMVNMMGASFNTFAINVLGVSPSIRRVGAIRFTRAMQKFATKDAHARYKWVLEKSPYMKERLDGFDRDLNTEVNRFTGKAGITPSLAVWFAGLSIMDRLVTMPTWIAAYEQSMEDSGNNEELSVKYADRVIRQTQGSGRVIDLAKVSGGVGSAGEFKRIMTMYYNFFSAQLGQMVRSKRLSESEWNEGKRIKAAMRFTLDTLSIIVIPATLEAIARGNCGDDPDAGDYMYCTARSSALFWTSMFPYVRDMVPFAWHQFDPDTKAFGVKLSPVESAMETMARTPKSIADIFAGEGTESDVRTLLRGLGYTFGLPGFQASRTVEGYQALIDGETDNPAVLLTGAPK